MTACTHEEAGEGVICLAGGASFFWESVRVSPEGCVRRPDTGDEQQDDLLACLLIRIGSVSRLGVKDT